MLQPMSAREIAVSGLRAQRTRMNVIANNLANAQTTRMANGGGAFRRQLALFRGGPFGAADGRTPQGVQVEKIVDDRSALRAVFDPNHPDADKDGYVKYPNVDIAVEMTDLIAAQRAYESNLAVMAAGKRMGERALDIMEV